MIQLQWGLIPQIRFGGNAILVERNGNQQYDIEPDIIQNVQIVQE